MRTDGDGPKRKRQTPREVAGQLYDIISSETGGEGQCQFGDVVAAFMNMPGVSHALGFPEECDSVDVLTGATILSNVKRYFEGSLSTTGPRFSEQRRVAEGVASSIFGDSLNMRSVTRLTGISSKLLESGGKLRLRNHSSNVSR